MSPKIMLTTTALALAVPAFADAPAVEKVNVDFNIQAIESQAAAEFWSNLEGDLEEAILKRVAMQIADEGATVSIDIDEFDLSNSFQAAIGIDSTLTADVAIKSEVDPTIETFYDVKITMLNAGYTDSTDFSTVPVEEAYTAFIEAFADNVYSKLK